LINAFFFINFPAVFIVVNSLFTNPSF